MSESEEEKAERLKKEKAEEEKGKKMEEMGQHLECQICYDIMHQAVSVMPCVHNFCGGCFSDWIMRQKDCPTCRKEIEGVSKSAAMNSMIE
jgi:E3 ubiquitin-protein ligase CHFR